MNRDDQPPPMPGSHYGEEETSLHVARQHDDAELALPDALPDLLPDELDDLPPAIVGGTGAKVTLRAIDEHYPGRESTNERQQRQIHNQQRRLPVDQQRRPTLMPSGFDAPPKLPSAPRTADPALVRPARQAPDSALPSVGQPRESSDVIQMFPAEASRPQPMYERPRGAPPTQPPASAGKLVRHAPGVRAQVPASPAAVAPPQAPVRPSALGPQVLPLSADRVAVLIADHRSRLQNLDLFARGLEIGAGLFGTVSLAVLIASLVSILLGNGQSVLAAGTAVVVSVGGLAITALMGAAAAGLRQIAHNTAQLAALLEALSQSPR